ncbi:hypothetical protein AAC387_Pa07g0092 [Persea americana]
MLSKRDKHRGLGREEIVGSSQFVAPIETELQNLQETKGGECGDLKYEGDLFYYEYGNGLYMSHDEDDNRTEVELVKDRGGDGLDTEKAYREIQMQVDDQLSDYEPQSDYESFKSSYDESERNFYNLKDDPRLEEMEPRLCIGMKSASAHQFRKCLTHYASHGHVKLQERRDASSKWTTTIVPLARLDLMKTVEKACNCRVRHAGKFEYKVDVDKERYKVLMDKRTCQCGQWQLCGMPCKHAVATIIKRREDLESYCDNCSSIEKYRVTYDGIIHAMSHKETWTRPSDAFYIHPPYNRRPPGRLRKERIKDRNEDNPSLKRAKNSSRTTKCSLCGILGHNRKTCKKPLRGERPQAKKSTPRCERGRAQRAGRWSLYHPTSPPPPSSRRKNSSSAFQTQQQVANSPSLSLYV